MTTTHQTDQPNFVEQKGWGGRLLDTFIAPEESFSVVRDHKSLIWLLTALLIILAVSFPQIIIIQRTIAQTAAFVPEAPPGVEFTEEELAMMQQGPPAIFSWMPLIGVVVGLFVVWLLWSGVILMFVSMFGGRTEFGRLWRLAIWASVPMIIQGLLNGIYLLVAGGVQPLLTSVAGFMTNPVSSLNIGSSPADFASYTPPSAGEMALYSTASWLDPFVIWRLLLLVLGVMIIAKLNWKKSAAIIFIPWLLGVGIVVGASSAVGF